MFCAKCGRQLADGEVCSCTQANNQQNNANYNAPQAKPFIASAGIKLAKLTFGNIISVIISTICFCSILGDWYSLSIFDQLGAMMGGTSLPAFKCSVLGSNIGDINGCFLVAKIFAIMAIVFYALSLVAKIIDLKAFVPAIDLTKIIDIAFLGTFFLALFLGFIGCVSEDGITMSFTWYAMVVVVAAGALNFVQPDLFKGIFKKSMED